MSEPTRVDWYARDGVRHAFVAPSFRSLCGEVRWTAALSRAEAPLCAACTEQIAAGVEVRRPLVVRPLTPGQKAEVHRRRWRRAHGLS